MLFRYPGMLGGKTGFTDVARKTFVGAAQRDGRRLVVAMMYGLIKEGGPTYWDQATALLDWGFAQDRRDGLENEPTVGQRLARERSPGAQRRSTRIGTAEPNGRRLVVVQMATLRTGDRAVRLGFSHAG